MVAVREELERELQWLRETKLALERLGVLDLDKAVEIEREQARIRGMLYELEKEHGRPLIDDPAA